MTRQAKRARTRAAADFAPRRLLLALACILSFSLQAYIAQTHIHPLSAPAAVAADAGHAAPAKQGKTDQDDTTCPFCQAAALAGAVLGSGSLLLALPAAAGLVLPAPVPTRRTAQSPSHVWRSRGPPAL